MSDDKEVEAQVIEKVSEIIRATETMGHIATSSKFNDPESSFDLYLPLLLGYQTLFYFTEHQLRNVREVCRQLCISNEVCKNVIYHRQNHIVGDGLTVTIFPSGVSEDPEKLATLTDDPTVQQMKKNWDAFSRFNKLTDKLKNWVERADRDGEVFCRVLPKLGKFAGIDVPQIRFVDPARIRNGGGTDRRYGIFFDPDDIETIIKYAYYNDVGDEFEIPADEVIHDKRNVDSDTLRGLPSFYPVITNLVRINKNLVNVSVLTSILSAIALIRKHALPMDENKLNRLMGKIGDGKSRLDIDTNKVKPAMKLNPGTIIDAPKGTEYETPAHGVDPTKFVAVIDKELAHIGLNFVLPVEWLCATEPATPLTPGSAPIKNFKTEQSRLYGEESPVMDLFWKVQVMMGIPEEKRLEYDVDFYGPTLGDSNPLDTAREEEIAIRNGASSPQKFAAMRGNKYVVERRNMIAHRKTKQEGEVMPGDAGNTNVTGDQKSTGQGGDGVTKKDGGSRGTGTPTKADK